LDRNKKRGLKAERGKPATQRQPQRIGSGALRESGKLPLVLPQGMEPGRTLDRRRRPLCVVNVGSDMPGYMGGSRGSGLKGTLCQVFLERVSRNSPSSKGGDLFNRSIAGGIVTAHKAITIGLQNCSEVSPKIRERTRGVD